MIEKSSKHSNIRNIGLILAVAVLYYMLARAGMLLAYENTNVTPVWPASGIAIAALLLYGYRIFPGILLGAFTSNLTAFSSNQPDSETAYWTSLLISIGSTLSALFGYYLLKKMAEDVYKLEKVKNVFLFVLTTLAICLISATIGTSSLFLTKIIFGEQYSTIWFTWFLGDITGILLITPLLLSWLNYFKINWQWNSKSLLVFLFWLGIIILSEFIFCDWMSVSESPYVKPYMIIPILLIASFYFDKRTLTTGIVFLYIIAIWGTANGTGSFSSTSINDSLLSLQLYTSTLILTILTLNATINEWKKSQEILFDAHTKLKLIAKERKEELDIFHKRVEVIYQIILKYSLFDFSYKVPISEKGDELDAIAIGLNTISEEFSFYVKKLAESEEQNRLLVENIKDYAIFMINPEGFILNWNKGAEHIVGYTTEDVIGKNISLFYTDEAVKNGEPTRNLKRALESGRFESEGIRIRKDGSHFWADSIYSPLYDEAKVLKGFIKITRDISERKKAEDELISSRNFLDSVLENIPNMIFVKEAEELRFVSLNKAGETLLGYKKAEILGKNDYDFFPKEQAEFFTSKDREVLKSKKLFEIPEETINTKNKGVRILSTKKIPILDSDGTPTHLLGISNDITKQKKMQDALQTSEEKFNKAFKLSPAGIAIVNLTNGKYVDANESFLNIIEYKANELIGHTSIEVPYLDLNERAQVLEEIKKTGSIRNREINFTKKSGKKGVILFSTELITIENEIHALNIVYEISDRIKAEKELVQKSAELERSNKELEQFAYIASHDLQEPLRMVNSYVQLLAKRYQDKLDQDAQDFIKFAVDGSNRMRTLIQSLLEYSRVNRVKPFEEINVNEVIQEVLRDIKSKIEEQHAIIKVGKLPDIVGDSVLIGQLFQNLILNAVKFTRKDVTPEIEVSGKKNKEGEYQFFVKDNGIGIESKYLDKIFVIFQRLHNKNEYPGTGIGLSICKKIVERHGGKIWVESEVDKGSTFYFTIKEYKLKQEEIS